MKAQEMIAAATSFVGWTDATVNPRMSYTVTGPMPGSPPFHPSKREARQRQQAARLITQKARREGRCR